MDFSLIWEETQFNNSLEYYNHPSEGRAQTSSIMQVIDRDLTDLMKVTHICTAFKSGCFKYRKSLKQEIQKLSQSLPGYKLAAIHVIERMESVYLETSANMGILCDDILLSAVSCYKDALEVVSGLYELVVQQIYHTPSDIPRMLLGDISQLLDDIYLKYKKFESRIDPTHECQTTTNVKASINDIMKGFKDDLSEMKG